LHISLRGVQNNLPKRPPFITPDYETQLIAPAADTLLNRYLSAGGFAPRLTREIRRHYYLAAACNALAGALRYHLWVAHTHDDPKRRMAGACAARDWLRIIRRAHEN
jgi:hypothetical protein